MALCTLTTDFATVDGYVGAMKGVICARAPGTQIVDITHEVPAHDISAGAMALLAAVPLFPPGTIHVAVVDPGVGGARQEVVIEAGGHFFVGPDNGLFQWVTESPKMVRKIETADFRRAEAAPTFHGRDVFAWAAAALASGRPIQAAGPETKLADRSTAGGDRVIHVDRFGNLVTNVRHAMPGQTVTVEGREVSVKRTFSDVGHGELVAYMGSTGFLEIAVREGRCADALGVKRGTKVALA